MTLLASCKKYMPVHLLCLSPLADVLVFALVSLLAYHASQHAV